MVMDVASTGVTVLIFPQTLILQKKTILSRIVIKVLYQGHITKISSIVSLTTFELFSIKYLEGVHVYVCICACGCTRVCVCSLAYIRM